jgi:rhodanese-related sulfurtransferase
MSYAGDINVTDAYRRLADNPQTVLVDVRSAAEWTFVGTPDLQKTGKAPILISWTTYPDGQANPHFLDELRQAGVSTDHDVLFLCRSGARSAAAASAATEQGYTAYNISDGFEGPTDPAGHRGTTAGWKAAGLPWVQP